ncbi:MAG: hypothetical protein WC709_12665, partial [Thermoleophilia bacterium]
MVKRFAIVALVFAATLLLAAPALAYNGYRDDYTVSAACAICHSGIAGIPAVYPQWSDTKHAVAGAHGQATRLPYGSSCAGCHTSNYSPTKVVPTPTATAANGNVSWGAVIADPFPAQSTGEEAFSENFVGCSSCHYGADVAGTIGSTYGGDPNDTAHASQDADRANADICGQCHSRYAYTADTYDVTAVPYVKVTTPLPGTPITPNPSPTTLLQPQHAIGFPMLGTPDGDGAFVVAPLSDYLKTQSPGWSPTPDPAATTAAGLMMYWKDAAGNDLPWQQVGHDGSAAQYPEWANEGHANSLIDLKEAIGDNPPATCLQCHSADYRIAKAGEKPTGLQAKYGITCVGCHTPHDAGTVTGVWDEEFDAQLIGDSRSMCEDCHNASLTAGQAAAPGTEIHHPMKEMMAGFGAIDVPKIPSVHKGKCIQCHMPPTSYSRGSAQLGGNHTFTIIEPGVAAEASPIPIRTTTPSPSASPVVTTGVMPYSACSTCHGRATDPLATYVQDTIEQRQEWTRAEIALIWDELDAGAGRLGYADSTAAHTALMAIPAGSRTAGQTSFLKAFTNVEFVESEGSYGIHNWAYTNAIVNKAIDQAQAAVAEPVVLHPWVVTFKTSKASVLRNGTVKFSGTVKTSAGDPGTGRVRIQMRKAGGSWNFTWKQPLLNISGGFATTVRMTARGTFYFRTVMVANADNLRGQSTTVKLVVR